MHEFVGYAYTWWAKALYRTLVMLSFGLVWVLGLYSISASLWMLQKCPLNRADYVCVQVIELSMQPNNTLSSIVSPPESSPCACLQLVSGHKTLVPVYKRPPATFKYKRLWEVSHPTPAGLNMLCEQRVAGMRAT